MGKFLVVCMFLMLAVVVSGRHLRYHDDLEVNEDKEIEAMEKAGKEEANKVESQIEKMEQEEDSDEDEVAGKLKTTKDKQLWKAITGLIRAFMAAENTGLEVEEEEEGKKKITVDGVVDKFVDPKDKEIIEKAIEEEMKLEEPNAEKAEEIEAEEASELEEELVKPEPAKSEAVVAEEIEEEKNALVEELEVKLEEGEGMEKIVDAAAKKLIGMMESPEDKKTLKEMFAEGGKKVEANEKKLEKLIAVLSMAKPGTVKKFIDVFDPEDRPVIESFIQKHIMTAELAEKEVEKEEKEAAEEESQLKDQRRKRVRDVIKGAVRLFRKFLN